MRWIMAIMLALGIAGYAWAKGSNPYATETILFQDGVVKSLGSDLDTTNTNVGLRTKKVQIYIEKAAIRYYLDGSMPSNSNGEILYDNDRLILTTPNEMKNFKGIAETSTTATGIVTYWRD